ncbi:DUF4349 domain-containing protein [Rhodocytophaga aerolata]|uniref:DUF4349 domain-containing protein n=1 Tax=Rhodocytophaga aerolata TaxID=455078 RepID=A0ABT8QZ99_9BACT|nr:DUF4349 domain-containing protein [Rhodocytophaga aerolata]MDO1445169.1 DUF4349 domain-containing protein [Rhodocytophaga aerolata]
MYSYSILKNSRFCYIVFIVLLFSCHNSNDAFHKESNLKEPAGNNDSISIQADTVALAFDTSERKFIRTADVKFKTKDVARTTQAIENLTGRYNGFVVHTQLTASVIHTSTFPVSADSLLERKEFTVENTMTIRVPNQQLDTLLAAIVNLADFVDFRLVKAEDIQLQVLENSLKIKRAAQAEKRYTKAIDEQNKKLPEKMNAEEELLTLQSQADQHTLANLAYLDRVNFSTVSLQFYQSPGFTYEVLANPERIKAFEPDFLQKLVEALASGWDILAEVALFLARIWALLVLGICGFWLYKKARVHVMGRL